MGPSQKLLWKIYIGVIGAVTTIVAQRLVTTGWKVVTGDEPPSPTDPDTPMVKAASWARGERTRCRRHPVAHSADGCPALVQGDRRPTCRRPARSSSRSERSPEASGPPPRVPAGTRGGALSGLTAPNQTGTPSTLRRSRQPGHGPAHLCRQIVILRPSSYATRAAERLRRSSNTRPEPVDGQHDGFPSTGSGRETPGSGTSQISRRSRSSRRRRSGAPQRSGCGAAPGSIRHR